MAQGMRAESATRRRRGRRFEELQGEAFWFGGVAAGAVTVTCMHYQSAADSERLSP